MSVDHERAQRAVRDLLVAIGEDPDRDGLRETPRRVASLYDELLVDADRDPGENLRVIFEAGHDEMVMVRDIPFTSLCEHHLVPFVGLAHVAYVPNEAGQITGLSKIARLVEGYARRLQVQERMTTEIVDAIERELRPRGSIVVIEAEHFCMTMRGVKKAGRDDRHVRGAGSVPLRRDVACGGAAVHPPEAILVAVNARVMGVVNVTPDSFFPDPRADSVDAAVARGREMFDAGADVVDVGGESTRPGALPVSLEVELARVTPVVRALSSDGSVSIDTQKSEVARACVGVGATIINDVSGSLAEVAGALGVGYVAMHRRGDSTTMQNSPRYDDVVAEVGAFLDDVGRRARDYGVRELWLDPGIGFGKTVAHNLSLLAHLDDVVARAAALGAGVLVGTSRKSFLGTSRRPRHSRSRIDWTDRSPRSPGRFSRARLWSECTTSRRPCRFVTSRRDRSRGSEREGQVGRWHRAPQLHVGLQRTSRRLGAAGRLDPRAPTRAPRGGVALAAAQRLHADHLDSARVAESPVLRGPRDRDRPLRHRPRADAARRPARVFRGPEAVPRRRRGRPLARRRGVGPLARSRRRVPRVVGQGGHDDFGHRAHGAAIQEFHRDRGTLPRALDPAPDDVIGAIELRGVRCEAVVGVLSDERTRPQPLSVDLDIVRPLASASRTDDLTQTTNYADVIAEAVRVATEGHFYLLEALAAAVAESMLALDDAITSVEVTVRKLEPPLAIEVDTVGVRVRVDRGS